MAITYSDGGVYKVVAEGAINAQQDIRNIFMLQLETGGVLSAAQGAEDIEEFIMGVYGVLEPFLHPVTAISSFSVYAMEGTNVSGSIPLTVGILGEATGNPTVNQVAMLTYMPLGESKRQLRKYWGVFGVGNLTSTGLWGTTNLNTINAGLAPFFLTTFEGTNGAWRFGHYTTGEPTSFIVPQSVITTNIPVVQRRRRVGSGS